MAGSDSVPNIENAETGGARCADVGPGSADGSTMETFLNDNGVTEAQMDDLGLVFGLNKV